MINALINFGIYTHLIKASESISSGNLPKAKKLLEYALSRPKNFDVPIHELDLIVHYFLGILAEKTGKIELSKKEFIKVLDGRDNSGDIKLFSGLAYQKLREKDKAEVIFNELFNTGIELLENKKKLDFFDPFAFYSQEVSSKKNEAKAYYLLALSAFGKGDIGRSIELAKKSIKLDNNNVGLIFRLGFTDSIESAYY